MNSIKIIQPIDLPPHIRIVYSGWRSNLLPGYNLPANCTRDFPGFIRSVDLDLPLTEALTLPDHTEPPPYKHFGESYMLRRVKKIYWSGDFARGVISTLVNLEHGGDAVIKLSSCGAIFDLLLLCAVAFNSCRVGNGHVYLHCFRDFKTKLRSDLETYFNYYLDSPTEVCFFEATPAYRDFCEATARKLI